MGRRKAPPGSKKSSAQKKPPLTHFLCLPLVTSASRSQLQSSLEAFRNDVAPQDSKAGEAGVASHDSGVFSIHPKAIRPLGALHCTLGVMSLSKDQLADAIELLKSLDLGGLLNAARQPETVGSTPSSLYKSEIPASAGGPLKVDLKGLVSMHAPQNTSILYSAPTDDMGRLLPFCLALQQQFKNNGCLVEDDRELKLHATIVNTIYAKGRQRKLKQNEVKPNDEAEKEDRSYGHGPHANAPLKIDATALLEKYKDYMWAEGVVLDRVAICEMGAKKTIDADGNVIGEEYTEVASVSLPTN